ncbi:MAG TPA: 30S ribosomal protein S4 [Acidimicrobiia bacterium]|uniref:Small ribosomal subunit protein uS4 n=1 Tax=uncultured actinobacterium Rifle_16ft_4_minimus_2010 TaxID=1665146 RepID=A0A0H4T1W3_9ACTN|nr:30S ribosomal protein S4, small subunit ribosomal protein S4 [uncultured actinobacterium Rifle_16ft_4_minimus_2010]HLE39311.1 30S ribosomal protein S4 [Acidimicrobiia bacterium]
MARYTGSVCKLCRRERTKLFLKGARCESSKCAIERKPYPPGEHGKGRVRETQYLIQLREKQKARRIYGVLEKQFRRYYKEAARSKGITGEYLLQILESRLDNVVYRAHFAESRSQARQLVSHGHFRINGHRVTIPSLRVRPGDVVTMREGSKEMIVVQHAVDTSRRTASDWLEVELAARKITITRLPSRAQIDTQVQEQLIVELYSK